MPASSFFSFTSPTFKQSGLDRYALTNDQLIRLVVEEPRYLRRPLVVIDGEPVCGASVKLLEGQDI